MLDKILYVFLAIAIITGVARLFIDNTAETVLCPADVGMCSDGSTVGRVAPRCEFSACPTGTVLDKGIVLPIEEVACTMDAMQCPDGSSVGRTGPNCEFVCPTKPSVSDEIQERLDAKADLITVSNPGPYGIIRTGEVVTGEARGQWFFEGSFPVVLTNWDGLIIAQGIATAEGEWMTTEFVPFKATLTFNDDFVIDANEGDGYEWPLGSLILQKDNPSGLPENDDALEIPIRFAK